MTERSEPKARTTISFKCSVSEAAYIKEIQELMSFGSQREATLFLIRQGAVAMKVATGAKLHAGEFAKSLYAVGRYGLDVGGVLLETEEAPAVADILREYDKWLNESRAQERRRVKRITSKRRGAVAPKA